MQGRKLSKFASYACLCVRVFLKSTLHRGVCSSCMSVRGKLRQKECGCSGSKSAEELRKIFVAGEKKIRKACCLHSPKAAAGSAELSA